MSLVPISRSGAARTFALAMTGAGGGDRPTDVTAKSPITETYVRKLARQHSIPEYLLRRYARARGELEARLPDWPQVAAVIGELGIGLDDAEFVGGVLWYDLTHRGSEGNPDDLKSGRSTVRSCP